MKTLRRMLAILPLVFMTNCDLLNNFFNPKLPEPIKPNTDHAPVLTISANPLSGYAPLNSELSLNVTDEDGDAITGYRFEIDYGDDGSIDETIESMSATETFPLGKSRVYGYAKAGDVRVKRNIWINAFPPTPNKLPIANLGVSPTLGQYPLTTNISLSGTDEDGTITGYKLEIDVGQNGTIEEIIEEINSINIERTFSDIGNVMIYGTVIDNNEGKTITGASVYIRERNDLKGNITFGSYQKGSKFTFSAQVQNDTNEEIVMDNINNPNKDSLEYRLIKVGITTPVIDKKFADEFILTLHKRGSLRLDYFNNNITVNNADAHYGTWDIVWDEIIAKLFPEGMSYPIPGFDYIFIETGDYFLETSAKYSIGSNNYHVKFTSNQFIVNE